MNLNHKQVSQFANECIKMGLKNVRLVDPQNPELTFLPIDPFDKEARRKVEEEEQAATRQLLRIAITSTAPSFIAFVECDK